ncbi:MAG: hypothetical protein D6805_08080 [Planctomycetota bacterium]|nr:MAG: hypothetical protein D6805_08080 [Planctomycetota bacterium]
MKAKKYKAFTLVELLIAIALMVILTGSIVYVFTQAQAIYSRTDASVAAYAEIRVALDTMEKDISHAYKTIDMEFWGPDTKQLPRDYNGHLDASNENHQYVSGASFPSGYNRKDYRTLDNPTYLYSMVVASNTHKDWTDNLTHWNDSIYFLTETPIGGASSSNTRTALVRYSLRPDNQQRRPPILMKWVMWMEKPDPSNPTTWKVRFHPNSGPQPLCFNITDLRIELYIKNKRLKEIGQFYTVEQAITKFKGSVLDSGNIKAFSPLYLYERNRVVSNGYSTNAIGTQAGFIRKDNNGEPYFTIDADKKLPEFLYQLDKGDTIFIYDPQRNSGGTRYLIPPGEYHIKDIRQEPPNTGEWRVYFQETLDTSKMDAENATQAEVSYRASWLPSAIRVMLKTVDPKTRGRKQLSRTIVRVFQILGS